MATMRRALRSLACALVLGGGLAAAPAFAERPYVAIEQRLSAEQMQATGLDQLSAEQLSLLNRLLSVEQTAVVEESRRERTLPPEPVTSAVKGEVRGWEKGTVFELENGQRWRVIEGDYYATKPLSNPKATVRPGVFSSWYLQIEGIGIGAKVKRVTP
ncbi:hypothetical protein [Lysobacter solisilvae (ex Woo and Kim 2020)]|uniref:Secreted protein n=1 Tax=Agrilutibacter terrestris TaxID=2865112 RepID=A0A7H0FZ13_9GAMM|nr:hypothetical protein [Lysobacter terrestris]QNP41279.1 hypothetical protein H8B22_03375 [Lysobacter terrestris]